MDFYEVTDKLRAELENLGYIFIIDFGQLLEHELDVIILGSIYEKFTVDLFKECLSDYRVPSLIITELRKGFRDNMVRVLNRSINRPTELVGDMADYDLATTWTNDHTVFIDIHSNPITTQSQGLNLNLSLLG